MKMGCVYIFAENQRAKLQPLVAKFRIVSLESKYSVSSLLA